MGNYDYDYDYTKIKTGDYNYDYDYTKFGKADYDYDYDYSNHCNRLQMITITIVIDPMPDTAHGEQMCQQIREQKMKNTASRSRHQ